MNDDVGVILPVLAPLMLLFFSFVRHFSNQCDRLSQFSFADLASRTHTPCHVCAFF